MAGTTWYDPQEVQDQADGAQTQPEFDVDSQTTLDPDKKLSAIDREQDTEGYEGTAKVSALIEGLDRIQAIIDSEITNDPEASASDEIIL